MNYEMEGRIKVVDDAQTFGSGFTKRGFVITVDDGGKYPQDIALECVQDKVSLLDDARAGDEVQVTFNIRGREYNGRYFNNLVAWKLSITSKGGSEPQASLPPTPEDDKKKADFDEYEDDIAF